MYRLRQVARHMSTTMKAIQIEKTGGVDQLKLNSIAVPKPGKDQVLIKSAYIGVNYIDTYFRTGLYPAPSLPLTLGREVAGIVDAVGEGQGASVFKVGDRVVATTDKAYAEYVLAPAVNTAKIPQGLDDKTAAAALLQGLTTLTLTRESYPVQKGDDILVWAAAGGVGLLLLQRLKQLGAHAIGVTSTAEKAELAKQHGAEHVILYTKEDVAQAVKKLTNGKGVEAVYDSIGKESFEASFDSLAHKGTFVSYGNASGSPPPLTLARLSAKLIKVLRPTMNGYVRTREEFDSYTSELFDLIQSGKLKINIFKEYPLKDVKQAHTDIESRGTTGKLLLKA